MLDFGLAKALSNETPRGRSDLLANPDHARHHGGHDHGHRGLHVAGAGPRAQRRQARRYLGLRRGGVRDAYGRQLFDGAHGHATRWPRSCTKDPDFATVPPRFQRLLRLCLTRDPRQRLRDIGDARLLLDEPAADPAQPRTDCPGQSRQSLAAIAAPAALVRASSQDNGRSPADPPQRGSRAGRDAGLRNTVTPVHRTARAWCIACGANGVVRLAMRALDQAKAQVLSGTDGASDPFFSRRA